LNSGNVTQIAGFWSAHSDEIIIGIVVGIIVAVAIILIQVFTKAFSRFFSWFWRKVLRQAPPLPQGSSLPFKYATSFTELESRIKELVPDLHGDLSIAYQPRLPQKQQQKLQEELDNSPLLILVGRMGIGKTREGIEALLRLEGRLGEPITILFPTPPFTASIALPSDIPKNHIVLFIDNLHNPPYYTPSRQSESTAKAGDFPTWFRECLTHFKGHADFRVIATVRNDLSRDYEETMQYLRPIIKEFGFEELALPSWDQNNVDILIHAMADARGITVSDDARKELARRCTAEGTPNYARLAVSRVEPGKTITLQQVSALPKTFNDLWQKTWDERIAPYPQRICLFNALALLRESGVTPINSVTLELAARLCGKPWWWHRRKVKSAVRAVNPWIEKKATTLECPEAYLPRDISIAQLGHAKLLAFTLRDLLPSAPQSIAPELNNFGNFLGEFPLGDMAQNLEEAIACFRRALEVYTKEAFPEKWAMTQNNLGTTYSDRISGDRAQNLEEAIACCNRALKVYTKEGFPEKWAGIQNNLGTTYSDRISGDRAQNLEEAIACYKHALEVLTREASPEKWAGIQNNLGIAYGERISGDRAQNLEEAIACVKRALEVYTREAFPEKWAMTQNNLGNAYNHRISGERAQNMEDAIACYKRALEVYTKQAFPEKWAMTQNNLGTAYSDRISGERAQNLEKAISCYRCALEVYTREAFPEDWAMTQNNLGTAYGDGDRAQNLEQAIACYKCALEVYTREAFPREYELTTSNLEAAERD
jgi:tetratricopeptide (TPR) repeat protein